MEAMWTFLTRMLCGTETLPETLERVEANMAGRLGLCPKVGDALFRRRRGQGFRWLGIR